MQTIWAHSSSTHKKVYSILGKGTEPCCKDEVMPWDSNPVSLVFYLNAVFFFLLERVSFISSFLLVSFFLSLFKLKGATHQAYL